VTRFTLGQLAEALHAKLDGDATRVVTGVAPLDAASPADISFVTDPRYESAARASRAGAFIAPIGTRGLPAAVLECEAPRRALVDLLTLFFPPPAPRPGIDPAAIVAPGALVDPTASIGPLTVVEAGARVMARVQLLALAYVGSEVEIGEDTVIHPRVVLSGRVRLGRRVIVHAGAVLGADGFGYLPEGGINRKIPQVGGVIVEDDVEIGANTAIDRAMLGDTIIRRGAKIDNLVQIAHNAEIGPDCLVAAQSGIAGSSRLGHHVVLGGQVGIGDHVSVGDEAMMASQSGTTVDLAGRTKYGGTWARPLLQSQRIWVAQAELPAIAARLKKLEQRLEAIEGRLPDGETP
jgi:UDP-3-O-[3-hydroxymyristoyl] glucosamine N-acyltransferase